MFLTAYERIAEMIFCPLYSGSSGNCTYIESGETAILIDAGLTGKAIENALSQIGADIGRIRGIVVTHEHSDHVKGIGVLSRRYRLPVYCTAATWRAMPGQVGVIPSELRREFIAGEDFFIGGMSFSPFSIPHDAVDPVGFRVWADGYSVSVATDMGYMRKQVMEALAGSDLILLESNYDPDMLSVNLHYSANLKQRIRGRRGHLSNDDCACAVLDLFDTGCRHVILGHMSGENNTPELALETVKQAAAARGLRPGRDITLDLAWRDRVGSVYTLQREP